MRISADLVAATVRDRRSMRIAGVAVPTVLAIAAAVWTDLSAVRTAETKAAELTATLALAATRDRNEATETAEALWAEAGLGPLVRLSVAVDPQRPDAVRATSATQVDLPVAGRIVPGAGWTVSASSSARRIASVGVQITARGPAPAADALSAVASAVLQTPVEIAPDTLSALVGTPIAFDPWFRALLRGAGSGPVHDAMDSPLPIALYIQAAAEVAAKPSARAILEKLADEVRASRTVLAPSALIDAGEHNLATGELPKAPGLALSADRLFREILRVAAAGRTVPVDLPTTGNDVVAAEAFLSIGSDAARVFSFGKLPAVHRTPFGTIVVAVTLPAGGHSGVDKIRIPVRLDVEPGRVSLSGVACGDETARLATEAEATAGKVALRFAALEGEDGKPPRIVDRNDLTAWVVGGREFVDTDPATARLSATALRPLLTIGRGVGLEEAVLDLARNPDVRIAGPLAEEMTGGKPASARQAIADVVSDARRPLAAYLAAVAAAVSLPVDGLGLKVGALACDGAEHLP